MILGFADKRTRMFAAGEAVPSFSAFALRAWIKLEMLEAARSLSDLAALPGTRLEALRGDRAGQYSIRINKQWRICFVWRAGEQGPSRVQIVDYH